MIALYYVLIGIGFGIAAVLMNTRLRAEDDHFFKCSLHFIAMAVSWPIQIVFALTVEHCPDCGGVVCDDDEEESE